jgi:hypothetical protein
MTIQTATDFLLAYVERFGDSDFSANARRIRAELAQTEAVIEHSEDNEKEKADDPN